MSKNLVNSFKLFTDVCHARCYQQKRGQKLFFTGKIVFLKHCVFNQHLRCHGNDLITSTVTVKLHVGPLQIVSWGLSHSIIPEKNVKFFCNWKDIVFFWKNVVLDFLGPKEKILSLAQYLLNYPVCPYKLFLHIFNVRYYQEKWANNFSYREISFFRNVCLYRPLRSNEKWSQHLQNAGDKTFCVPKVVSYCLSY